MIYYITTCAAFDEWLTIEPRASIFETTITSDGLYYVILVDETSEAQITLLADLSGVQSFSLGDFNLYVEEHPEIFASSDEE